MRKQALAALAITTLIALVGCSTKKDDTSSATTSAGTSAVTTGPTQTSTGSTGSTPTGSTYTPVVDDRAQGVTADSVKVGIMYTDFTRVGPLLGYDDGDAEAAYRAIIDDINSKGGINGRKIVPVFAAVDPSSTDGPTAACTKLAEDEHVFIAIGFVFGEAGPCLYNTNETLVLGGNQTEATLADAKVGWWTIGGGEDSLVQGMQTLADKGKFSKKITIIGTSADQPLIESKILPILAGVGITPLDIAYLDPTFDANQTYADAQTIAERFKADGSDQVLMISLANTFPQGLLRTDWRPQMVFDSLGSIDVYTSDKSHDMSVMKNSIGTGMFDGANAYQTLGSPTDECLATQTAAGLKLMPKSEVPKGESIQIASSLFACAYMYLLKAGLEGAGPDLNNGTFTNAMNNLGDIYLPGYPDVWHFGPPPHTDGDPTLHVFMWDEAKQMMVVADA